jgi:hypothetical protein
MTQSIFRSIFPLLESNSPINSQSVAIATDKGSAQRAHDAVGGVARFQTTLNHRTKQFRTCPAHLRRYRVLKTLSITFFAPAIRYHWHEAAGKIPH